MTTVNHTGRNDFLSRFPGEMGLNRVLSDPLPSVIGTGTSKIRGTGSRDGAAHR